VIITSSTNLIAKRWQLILSLIALPLSVLAFLAAGFEPRMKYPLLAVLAWIGAMTLVVVGSWNFKPKLPKYSRSTALIIILLFEFALLVRAVYITRIPRALTGDEGSIGLMAVEFIQGTRDNIFTVGWFGFPSLYFFTQSLFVRLLGNTTPALRIPSAIVGASTVVAVYLLARAMFNKWTGVYAAVFMLGFHFHIHFSRLGLQNVWDGLWYTLVLGFLWLGWTKENRAAFLAAGFSLGFAQYFYVSSRALFLVIPLWLLIVGLMDRNRFKRNLPDLIRMSLATTVTLIPLGLYYVNYPNIYLGMLNRVSIFKNGFHAAIEASGQSSWQFLLHQLSLGIKGFVIQPIRFIYQPGVAMLRPISAGFFIIGFIFLFFRIRDPKAWLLLIWLLIFVPIVGFSDSAPCSQRYVAAAPATAILVGLSLGKLAEFSGRWIFRTQQIANFFSLAVVTFLCISDLDFYFMEYTPNSDMGRTATIAQSLADYLQEKDETWTLLFFGEPGDMVYRSIASLSYLAPYIQGVDVNGTWDSYVNPNLPADHLIFVFLSQRISELDSVKASFPGGRTRHIDDPKGKLLYSIYEVDYSQITY
jgi:uncharacterized membrane protein